MKAACFLSAWPTAPWSWGKKKKSLQRGVLAEVSVLGAQRGRLAAHPPAQQSLTSLPATPARQKTQTPPQNTL